MEEELKHFQKLRAENERLKSENRALTRVVSKLTASAAAAKAQQNQQQQQQNQLSLQPPSNSSP